MKKKIVVIFIHWAFAPVPFLCSIEADAQVRLVLLPYLSHGYYYLEGPHGHTPGFELPVFDDSGFSLGDAAFGMCEDGVPPECFCPLDPTVRTPWSIKTDILLRKIFVIPSGAFNVKVHVAIDNIVQVFINGVEISHGMQYGYRCAKRDYYVFSVPHKILVYGNNLLAVRARDLHVTSYVDLQVTADFLLASPSLQNDVNIAVLTP
jgi:hypothetical protein